MSLPQVRQQIAQQQEAAVMQQQAGFYWPLPAHMRPMQPMPNLPGMIPSADDAGLAPLGSPHLSSMMAVPGTVSYGSPNGIQQMQQQQARPPMLGGGMDAGTLGSLGDFHQGINQSHADLLPGQMVVLPDGSMVPMGMEPPYAKWLGEDGLMVYIGAPLRVRLHAGVVLVASVGVDCAKA